MKTIWKFPIPFPSGSIEAPAGSQFLSVQSQHGQPQMWLLVDPAKPLVSRAFVWRGTGHPVSDGDVGTFLGTLQAEHGALVFHLFETTP